MVLEDLPAEAATPYGEQRASLRQVGQPIGRRNLVVLRQPRRGTLWIPRDYSKASAHRHHLSLLRSGRDRIASWFEDVELDQG